MKSDTLAFDGSHCIAVTAGNSDIKFYRTFFRTQLLCKMRKGHQYKLEFYLRSNYPILDSIGIYFSRIDFIFERNLYYKLTPAFYVTNAKIQPSENPQWKRITMIYEATGQEFYLAVGNFSKRDIGRETRRLLDKNFLVYADNFSLFPVDKNEKLCSDWQTTRDAIYSQHERHDYLWRYIQYYQKNPPDPPEMSVTISSKTDTIIIPDVLFKTDSYDLTKNNLLVLDSIQSKMKSMKIDSVVIEGHTDNMGSVERNEKLSVNRATSVSNYLVSAGTVPPQKVFVRGWASRRPVATNATEEGRRKNRRVEVYLYSHD